MDLYKQKLVTAERAASLVKSGDWVQYGEFVMQPKDCDAALAARKDELTDVKFRLVTMSWVPKVCQVDPERKHFIMNDWHFSGASRKLHTDDLCFYIPLTYHEGPGFYDKGDSPVDVCFQPVTSMDENGYFNIGTSNSISTGVLRNAKIKVVEVNFFRPGVPGGIWGIHTHFQYRLYSGKPG